MADSGEIEKIQPKRMVPVNPVARARRRELEKRVKEMYLRGTSTPEIVETLKIELPVFGRERIHRAVRACEAAALAQAQRPRNVHRTRIHAALWETYRQCMSQGDLKAAVAVMDRIARLTGAYPKDDEGEETPAHRVVDVTPGAPAPTVEVLEARMKELEAPSAQ